MMSEKNSFLVVGSLSCNGFFLKEAFDFFDEVYVSNEVPHNEMSRLFFAKKPKVILISIDKEASPLLYMYINEIKKIIPHTLIAIVFQESISVKSINAVLEMHCDFYTFFQEDKEWIHTCLNDIISSYRHKKEADIMKRYFQYLLENSLWKNRISNQNKEGSTFSANTLIISFVDEITGTILDDTAIQSDAAKVLNEQKRVRKKPLLQTKL